MNLNVRASLALVLAASASTFACSSSSSPSSGGGSSLDAGQADVGASTDASTSADASDAQAVVKPASNITHVVIIVQENHTFDTYFGKYCTAATGSNPTCTAGPACCEAGPAMEPSGSSPETLDDTTNAAYDPDHTQGCELLEIDNGKMDGYVTAPSCGTAKNFAYADPTLVMPYWNFATAGALADRYFQPVAGQSSSNDMYLARAKFVFLDNSEYPNAVGTTCTLLTSPTMEYSDPTIGDLLNGANVGWSFFAEGYALQKAAGTNSCAAPPTDCPAKIPYYPCDFDPSDDPFEYYSSLVDNPKYIQDYANFTAALSGSTLPPVSFVKGYGYHTEHPGYGDTISAGVTFVTGAVSAIEASAYASSTLVLVTYDEGGGFFDHVTPPAMSAVDNEPYGTRVPLIAIGPFAKKNYVSHVQMEHSSIVKFIEWNWLGGTGQLKTRDAVVNNIGDVLDPAATGVQVPSN